MLVQLLKVSIAISIISEGSCVLISGKYTLGLGLRAGSAARLVRLSFLVLVITILIVIIVLFTIVINLKILINILSKLKKKKKKRLILKFICIIKLFLIIY